MAEGGWNGAVTASMRERRPQQAADRWRTIGIGERPPASQCHRIALAGQIDRRTMTADRLRSAQMRN
jgi:hypothetical protein